MYNCVCVCVFLVRSQEAENRALRQGSNGGKGTVEIWCSFGEGVGIIRGGFFEIFAFTVRGACSTLDGLGRRGAFGENDAKRGGRCYPKLVGFV